MAEKDLEKFRMQRLEPVFPSENVRTALSALKNYSPAEKSLLAVAFMQAVQLQQQLTEIVRERLLQDARKEFIDAYDEQHNQDTKHHNSKDRLASHTNEHDEIRAVHQERWPGIDKVFSKLQLSIQAFEDLRLNFVADVVEQLVEFCDKDAKSNKLLMQLVEDIQSGYHDALISQKGILRSIHLRQLKNTLIELGDAWATDMSRQAIDIKERLMEGHSIYSVIERFLSSFGLSALTEMERRRVIFIALILLLFEPSRLEDREISFSSIIGDAAELFVEQPKLADDIQEALDQLHNAMNAFTAQVMPYLEEMSDSMSVIRGAKEGIQRVGDLLSGEMAERKQVLQEIIELQLERQQSQADAKPAPVPR